MSEWSHVAQAVKTLHSVGRTCTGLQPSISHEAVVALEDAFGTVRLLPRGGSVWHLSLAQRLDLVATSIIREDRRARGDHRHRQGILSMSAAQMRSERELPWEDMDSTPEVIKAHDREHTFSRFWYGQAALTGGNHYRWML